MKSVDDKVGDLSFCSSSATVDGANGRDKRPGRAGDYSFCPPLLLGTYVGRQPFCTCAKKSQNFHRPSARFFIEIPYSANSPVNSSWSNFSSFCSCKKNRF